MAPIRRARASGCFLPTRWAAAVATNANTDGCGGGRRHCRPFSFQRGELSPPRTQPRTFAGAPFCLIGDRLPACSRVLAALARRPFRATANAGCRGGVGGLLHWGNTPPERPTQRVQ